MFASKPRLGRLSDLVYLAVIATATAAAIARLSADEPKPAQPKPKALKLEELQKERLESARAFAAQTRQRVKSGAGKPEDSIEAARMVFDAEFDLCKSDQERITVLEKFVDVAKENERIAVNFHKVGQGLETTAMKAKVLRLQAEIALERARIKADATTPSAPDLKPKTPLKVKVVQPQLGDLERVSVQPATVQAFESAWMFSRVSGFVKKQNVDIGDRVKSGQILAVLDVPDLEAQAKHDRSAADLARLRVLPAKARLVGSQAELEVSRASVEAAEANLKSAAANILHREKELKRMRDLLNSAAIDQSVVDEAQSRYQGALEAEQAAKAAVTKAKAEVAAGQAKIEQAKADLAVSEAEVKVALAALEKSEVMLSFATIAAPFEGIVTRRGCLIGEFIRSADLDKSEASLFTVERTDLMRVVAEIPASDVLDVDVGGPAEIEFDIDIFGGKPWKGKIARMARALDPKGRTMRVELDLPNADGKVVSGMHGQLTIGLGAERNALLIPSSCVVRKNAEGKGEVFIVRDGRAHRVRVQLGSSNSKQVAIRSGLTAKDQVIVEPGTNVSDGREVTPSSPE